MEDLGGHAKRLWEDLAAIAKPARERRRLDPAVRDDLILKLCSTAPLSVRELARLIDRTEAYTGDALRPLLEAGTLGYVFPEQPRHPRQRYVAAGSAAETLGREAAAAEPVPPADAQSLKASEQHSLLAAMEDEASRLWPVLESAAAPARDRRRLAPDLRDEMVLRLCSIAPLSARELATLLGRSEAYIADAIQPLVKTGQLLFLYAEQPRHPRQKYRASSPLADSQEQPLSDLAAKAPELPAQAPPASVVTAQQRWTELEDEARPARENRYLGGVDFENLLEQLCGLAPISPREAAILTDRREEYVRQVLEEMAASGRLRLLTDESMGTPRTKYQAVRPYQLRPAAPPVPIKPTAAPAVTVPAEPAAAPPSPVAGPASEPPRPRPTPVVSPTPVTEAQPAGVGSSGEPAGPAPTPPPSRREHRGFLSPGKSLVLAILAGVVLGLSDPAGWWVYALAAAFFMASLHILTDSPQYRRYRVLNPRRDRVATFWTLKLLISLTEVVLAYALVTTL